MEDAHRQLATLQFGRATLDPGAGANAVNQQADVHAAVGSRHQRHADPRSESVIGEDVGLEIDAALCRRNVGEDAVPVGVAVEPDALAAPISLPPRAELGRGRRLR